MHGSIDMGFYRNYPEILAPARSSAGSYRTGLEPMTRIHFASSLPLSCTKTYPRHLLVLGRRYPETRIRKIHGKKCARIRNSPLVFPDTSYLRQAYTIRG